LGTSMLWVEGERSSYFLLSRERHQFSKPVQ
jgi:hypothetical protein